MSTRTFKLVSVTPDSSGLDLSEGRYTGRGPLQAGRKAFSKYCSKAKIDKCRRKFVIQETTRDSAKKTYEYVGERKKLSPPKEIRRGDAVYTVKHENVVKRLKE